MKKLYRKSTVHPKPSVVSDHLLSFLPAAILSLTAALSLADREVLAYLISGSSASFANSNRKGFQKGSASRGGSKGGDDHMPCFNCNCFRCYMSYWVKWDASPNRQLIHEIIDAFEESLLKGSTKEKSKRERRKGKQHVTVDIAVGALDEPKIPETGAAEANLNFWESSAAADGSADETGHDCAGDEDIDEETEDEAMEKGSVRRLVNFLGERIWSVWG